MGLQVIHISFWRNSEHICVHFNGLELMCRGYRLDGDVEPYVLLFCGEELVLLVFLVLFELMRVQSFNSLGALLQRDARINEVAVGHVEQAV